MVASFYSFSQRDQKFAREAAMGNLMEVKLGELATKNGYSETIRQLGQNMVKDHTDANGALLEITQKKGIIVPMQLDEKEQELYDKLAKKNAEEFDKAYAKVMVKDHKKDICKFKKEAKKGRDAELKGFASATVPVLEHHLQMAKDACKAIRKK